MRRLGWSPDDGAVDLVAHANDGGDDDDSDGEDDNDGHRVPAGHRGVTAMLRGSHPRHEIGRS